MNKYSDSLVWFKGTILCLALVVFGGVGEGYPSTPTVFTAQEDLPGRVPDMKQLTPPLQKRIDELAGQVQMESAGQKRIDFSGDVVAWAISQAVLPPKEELREATKTRDTLLPKVQVGVIPGPVEEVFGKLIRGLPTHLNPREFEWALTVIESQEVNAFTAGGGFIFALRPLLNALMADSNRGTGAVAAILAHEIGHVVLGHCRRGYQLERIEADMGDDLEAGTQKELLKKILRTSINKAGSMVKFLYTREQECEADLFALQLCRNVGVDQDQVIDAFRWLVMLHHPRLISDPHYMPADGKDQGLISYFLKSHPDALLRLRKLQMELAGTLPDETRFGLFAWNSTSDRPTKAEDGEVGAETDALVLVHGLGGSDKTFVRFREVLAKERPQLRVLLFRYPNNGSLAHAARFLSREMGRVIRAPQRATFVCHSAGGLVARTYAEKLEGKCARIIFLGTPHRGSNLARAKFLVDLGRFVPALRKGILEAIDETVLEGEGQIGHDLHPDSLFLRWLGEPPAEAENYHAQAGQYLNKLRRIGLEEAFPLAKKAAMTMLEARNLRPAWVREAVLARVGDFQLTDEITQGDGVVSVASATAAGKAPKTWPNVHHTSLTSDQAVLKAILELLR